jgi:hypothetical protein
MGGTLAESSPRAGFQQYRIVVAVVLSAFYVAVKAFHHDYWSVGFGLALLGIVLLTPSAEHGLPAWRQHALRVVTGCFVVVALGSIATTLLTGSP